MNNQKKTVGVAFFDALEQHVINSMLPYQTKWVYYHRAANFQGHQHTSSTVEALIYPETGLFYSRYPEYLSADVTSQTNTEKRDLLLVGGLTGRNKAFTAMRCLLPSGARWTFNWVFSRAFPLLLGEDNLKKVCVYFF